MERKTLEQTGRLINTLKEYRRFLQFYFKFSRKIKKIHRKGKVAYVCAENAVHGNMGDQALGYCRTVFLKSIGISEEEIIEYTARDRMRYWPQICKAHSRDDIIIMRGGGFWGDLWRDGFEAILEYIKQFQSNRIVVFPQSVYFGKTESSDNILIDSQRILKNTHNLYVFARDVHSYELLRKYYPHTNIFCTSDTVLSFTPKLNRRNNRSNVLVCLRDDKEKNTSLNLNKAVEKVLSNLNINPIYQDTSIDWNLKRLSQRDEQLYKLWSIFASAKLVITDRLYGMIFAAITATPCIVFDNIDKKVSHQYEWLKGLGYITYLDNVNKLQSTIINMSKLEQKEYPIKTLEKQFESLKKVLCEF